MKSKNKFIKKNIFYNYSFWYDYYGIFLIPTIIFDKNLPISPLTKITRISFYFLKFRFCIDIGKIKNKHEYNWENAHLNKYLQWWRKEIKRPINKEKIEDFIEENPYIKKVLEISTADHYYVKRLIFKNYISQKRNG